jgi:phosphoglycolate phosphatase
VTGSGAEIATLWAARLPGRRPHELAAEINRLSAEIIGAQSLVPAVPDLRGLLGTLRARGLALGVATNDGEAAARAHLEALGVLDAFDLVLGADSGHGAKPGRGMLDAFARATRRAPGAIAMVGDGIHDLAMRRHGAGLAVAVLTGVATHADLAPHADHVLPSIAALPALLDTLATPEDAS